MFQSTQETKCQDSTVREARWPSAASAGQPRLPPDQGSPGYRLQGLANRLWKRKNVPGKRTACYKVPCSPEPRPQPLQRTASSFPLVSETRERQLQSLSPCFVTSPESLHQAGPLSPGLGLAWLSLVFLLAANSDHQHVTLELCPPTSPSPLHLSSQDRAKSFIAEHIK